MAKKAMRRARGKSKQLCFLFFEKCKVLRWPLGKKRKPRPAGQCTKCKKIYPETEEFFNRVVRRGRIELKTTCKTCSAATVREWAKKNAAAVLAYDRMRRQRPHHRAMLRKAWQKFHAKPEYREKDRAQYRKTVSTLKGREKIRAKVRRRRARANGSTHHHTSEDVLIAMGVQQNLCFYCQADVSIKYTVDHLTPLVRGGSDGPENIVIACASCNFHKADRTPEEFAAQMKHERKQWRSRHLIQ